MTWRVIEGDCREVMRTLDTGSVDVVVTDPPYGETSLDWDRRVDGWLAEVRRVLRLPGTLWCFGSMRFFMERAGDFLQHGWVIAQDVVWEKHNGSNAASDRFRRVHEIAVQFYPADVCWETIYKDPQTTPDAVRKQVRRKRRPKHWGDIGESSYESHDGGPRKMRSVIYSRSCHGAAIHPTQKPTTILEPLIRYSCPPGGLVLDPFAGSGSTGIAAVREGRRFVGIELSPAHCAAARERFASDAPLFNAPSEAA